MTTCSTINQRDRGRGRGGWQRNSLSGSGERPTRRRYHNRGQGSAEDSEGQAHGESEQWGDRIERIGGDIFRVGFLNHGGFNTKAAEGKGKEKDLFNYISKYRFSVIGLAENNVSWKEVPAEERLTERTKGWFEALTMNTAYFKEHPVRQKFQPGGCDIWSINKASYRVLQRGADTTGLARWTWTRYRGREGLILRVIAAYRPVPNQEGAMSVWNQQKAFFLRQGNPEEPRHQFILDLVEEMKKWMEMGDQIVLGIDANEPLHGNSQLEQALGQPDLNLQNAITTKHGTKTPNTRRPGSKTIDTIFCSRGLQGLKCGYTAFEDFDHRGVWIDIPVTQAFGIDLPKLIRPPMRRLQLRNKRAVKKVPNGIREVSSRTSANRKSTTIVWRTTHRG
jgi:hypothetical protein